MKTVFSWFRQRPFRFIGGLLVFLSIGLIIFLTLLEITSGMPNPYVGLLTYMILPGVLAFGLILVPIDALIQRRRVARGEPILATLDLQNPSIRKIAMFFAISSVFVLICLTLVAYKGVEYMDTKDFCGKVCHKVMLPEYTAYSRSSHSSVSCIECHIGPGASWFVKSKLSGASQTWHYLRGDYPRPIATPVAALRPSRDTCENCHSPQRFYGNRLHTSITYEQDEKNTKVVSRMEMKVGSGGVQGSGIHSHMVSTIDYLPGNDKYTEMAWVSVKRPDGSSQEFANPAFKDTLAKLKSNTKTRRMDCIDCHNRAAHDFLSYERLIDDAMTMQIVDPRVPFIKREAIAAVGDLEEVPTYADQKAILAKIDAIPAMYQQKMPDVYKEHATAIAKSTKAIRELFLSSSDPHMRVSPTTYPNWRSHDGCFRCHGAMEASKPGRDKEISQDCNYCHTDQSEVPSTP